MREFELRSEHIVLLGKLTLEYDDNYYKVPMFDSKRPYGNSGSTAIRDMAKHLGLPLADQDEDEDTWEDQKYALLSIHNELPTALSVILSAKSFVPGIYQCLDWHDAGYDTMNDEWKYIGPAPTRNVTDS